MESSIVVFTFDGCIYVCVSACSKTKTLSRTIWKINSQIMMKMVSCSPLLLLCVIDGNQSLMVLNLCVLLHCFFHASTKLSIICYARIGEFHIFICVHTVRERGAHTLSACIFSMVYEYQWMSC